MVGRMAWRRFIQSGDCTKTLVPRLAHRYEPPVTERLDQVVTRARRLGGVELTILATGPSGLIGGKAAEYLTQLSHSVIGIDNNMRADFFGKAGDTLWNQRRLSSKHSKLEHLDIDVRDRSRLLGVIRTVLTP
jgi:nucleoside-diphosphate-sugar epimerase